MAFKLEEHVSYKTKETRKKKKEKPIVSI